MSKREEAAEILGNLLDDWNTSLATEMAERIKNTLPPRGLSCVRKSRPLTERFRSWRAVMRFSIADWVVEKLLGSRYHVEYD